MSFKVYRILGERLHWTCMLSLNEAEISAVSCLREIGEKLYLIDRPFIDSLSNQNDFSVWFLRFSNDMGDSLAIALS